MPRVLLTILVAFLLMACGAPKADAVLTPIEGTAVPAETSTPAVTPESAAPAVDVTSTPEPTSRTDVPTDPGVSDQASAYVADVSRLLETYATWITTLESQSAAVASDPGLLRDEQWKQEGVAALVALRITADRLSRLDAGGSEVQSLDVLVQQIAGKTEPMAVQFNSGLDEADADKIASASTSLRNIRELITEINMELSRFR